VDAQCDKLATVELSWQHFRRSHAVAKKNRKWLSSESGTKFETELPLYTNSSTKQQNTTRLVRNKDFHKPKTNLIHSAISTEHRLVTD